MNRKPVILKKKKKKKMTAIDQKEAKCLVCEKHLFQHITYIGWSHVYSCLVSFVLQTIT